jgi:uncharacterized protein
MQQQIALKLLPTEASSSSIIQGYAASALSVDIHSITGYVILKRSIDARSRQVWINLTILVYINEPFHQRRQVLVEFPNVAKAPKRVIIVGAGPAGLFAALRLIELGIKPIILERGKDVRSRRRDLALLNKEGAINPESNYCFGEGGAGTYSDGKLYTRSNKRGDINRILNLFVQFGAAENILYEAHPHIGTNKLPHIISAMRLQILDSGGEFYFDKKMVDINVKNNSVASVTTTDGGTYSGDALILATGHSARDVYELLHSKQILVQSKPFALGVRVEHPQSLIDSIQYHCQLREESLPPASYSLVQQVEERGVFSFCMCPGGIIAPASTNPGELVVNGWSPSKRNNPFANSGMVVTIEEADIEPLRKKYGPLAGLHFQRQVEQAAFDAGGGQFVAPALRMTDFIAGKISNSLPDCSYLPGIAPAPLNEVLPAFVYHALREGFRHFGNKMKGWVSEEAVVVATESRTSSPVRIPRDPLSLQHPQLAGLYPCGEGAGYAGGIVSAAMDGERVADAIAHYAISRNT